LTKQTQFVYTQEIRFFYFSDDQYWRKCSVSIVFPMVVCYILGIQCST